MMHPGPVIEATLRPWSRRPWLAWVRVAAAGPLLLVLMAMGGAPGAGPGRFGTGYFNACVSIAALVAIAFGTLATLDVVARERREGTLDLLLLTPLGPPDILLGKLMASGALVGQGLVATFPLAAIAFLAGGPTGSDLAWAAAAILNLLFVSMALGLAASARVREPMTTMALGAALGLGVHGVLPGLCLVNRWAGLPDLARVTSWFLPVFEVRPWELDVGLRPASDAWVGLVASHALGWVFILWARANLRRVATEKPLGETSPRRPRASRGKPTWTGEQRVAAVAGASGWIRWLGPMVAWGSVAVLGGIAVGGRGALGGADLLPSNDAMLLLGLVIGGASLWQRTLYAWEITRFFHDGRTSGLLELLMTTPVGGHGFMARFWREAMRGWTGPCMAIHGAGLLGGMAYGMASGGTGDAAGLVFIVLIANALAEGTQLPGLVHAGAWVGLTTRSMTVAMARVVLGVVMVPTALVGMCCVGALVGWLQGGYYRNRMRNPVNDLAAGLGPRWTPLDGILHPLDKRRDA